MSSKIAVKDNNNYAEIYEQQRKKIEIKIQKILKNKKPASLYEPCDYIIQSGGKRLRPLLVLLSAKAVGGRFENAYNAALAVELFHNFTLVHDDIMDNADKRRGRKTLHKLYDLSTAILAGDSLIAIAYQKLLQDCKDNDKSVLSTFTQGIIEVCEGQSLDKEFEIRKSVSIKEYIRMIEKKTAALLEVCCSIGAELGGGTADEIKALKKFGKNLGLAFQIQDDLLDITADEKEFGKKIGGDLIEGKKTYLFLKALEKAKGADLKLLKSVLINKGIKAEDVIKYKTIYDRLGILEDAKKEIERYTKIALKQLSLIKHETERETLAWLADTLLKRNK